jgi:hypothetical protein
MRRHNLIATAIAALAIVSFVSTASAEPARSALVIGNGTYSTLAPIPGCLRSANSVAAALRAAGYNVTDLEDATSGAIDAGVADFSHHLADGKGPGFIYICGYATDFNSRAFLLPITANISRPSDLLTQAILAKSMLGTVSHDPATVAVVVLDLVAQTDATSKIDLYALTGVPVPEGVGIIAAQETSMPDAATPLATAIASALSSSPLFSDALLTSVQTKLAGSPLTTVTMHAPAHPGYLLGGPAEAKPAAAQVPPPGQNPTGQNPTGQNPTGQNPTGQNPTGQNPTGQPPTGQTPTAQTPAPVPAATPPAGAMVSLPDDARMTEDNRRMVQSALLRLGYYDRQIDGVFGPDTRAAIRRFQHEIGSEMTGQLTAEQATRLVNTK